MRTARLKAVVAGLVAAAAVAAPASASWGGTGTAITIGQGQRSVTGGGNYVVTGTADFVSGPDGPPVYEGSITASGSSSTALDTASLQGTTQSLVVEFECHATAGSDATQTRVVPGGCVLYKGGTVVGSAPGQSLPGPSTATQGTATVGMWVPGDFVLCWNVSATYLLNGGDELDNAGCT